MIDLKLNKPRLLSPVFHRWKHYHDFSSFCACAFPSAVFTGGFCGYCRSSLKLSKAVAEKKGHEEPNERLSRPHKRDGLDANSGIIEKASTVLQSSLSRSNDIDSHNFRTVMNKEGKRRLLLTNAAMILPRIKLSILILMSLASCPFKSQGIRQAQWRDRRISAQSAFQ